MPGRVWETSNRETLNLAQVKGKAGDLERLYRDAKITFSVTSDLATLINTAKFLGDSMLSNKMDKLSPEQYFRAFHLDRIADAALPLANVEKRKQYLLNLVSGKLDLFNNDASLAKDTLWELELWSSMLRSDASATLQDPPDIVVELTGGRIAIACKKIYSERNLEKNLSEAVGQVEGDYDVGIVAMNLDALVPAGQFLRTRTEREMANRLQGMNADFLRRHDRHLTKYLSTGRLICALVSIHAIVEVKEWRVPLD